VSPLTEARPGSKHGYDVIDHDKLNPELGSEQEFNEWCEELRRLGLGQIVDVVPNHMAVLGARNPWWHDVLMHGEASQFTQHFDIDGLGASAAKPPLAGKVLLPILGDQYGAILERGELELQFDSTTGTFEIAYFDHRLPLDPRTLLAVFELAEPQAAIVDRFVAIPERDKAAPGARSQAAEAARAELAQRVAASTPLRSALQSAVAAINADRAALHALLEAQAYRLAHWRVAADDINYRRFFDINDLAGVRVELPHVFDDVHRLVFRWVQQGCVDGLRIDHPDGLADPAKYFYALQARAGAARAGDTPLYVVVEKILAAHESLPDWPVHGDSGYRFAYLVNVLFVDAREADRFTQIYEDFTGQHAPYAEVLTAAKHQVLSQSLASEFARLVQLAHDIALARPQARDFTSNTLRAALAEVIAAFPVYRTYIAGGVVSDADRQHIDWAISIARQRARGIDSSVFDFLRSILLSDQTAADVEPFIRRFQQVTAPVTAKAMEDTSFYRYLRLVSLNEVGSDPGGFGLSLETFHRAMSERREHWPHALSGTSTHDTKRSEDVRARINVLSEMPRRWRFLLRRFARMNARHKVSVGGDSAPSANDEYLLYQTLIGTWPCERASGAALASYRSRIADYMRKAAREAKLRTSWVSPDAEYEAALERFIERLLAEPARSSRNRFVDALDAEAHIVARFGASNSIAQVLIKCIAPGVPDFYQGCETSNLRLVDPDNRQPVDFDASERLLEAVERGHVDVDRLLNNADPSALKLLVTRRALQVRAAQSRLFAEGDYVALQARNLLEDHVVAFSRTLAGHAVVVVATRLPFVLAGSADGKFVGMAWGNTEVSLPSLPAAWHWKNELTNEVHVAEEWMPVARLLSHLPVALLVAGSDDTS
ncbi:MAG: malto-oligosyltrehalose synthase, partial [Burkholderiaceae bacterium]